MSVSRPIRCLFLRQCIPSKSPKSLKPSSRNFHSSPSNSARRRPNNPSVKASDMGLLTSAAENYKSYTPAEKAELSKHYTPAQISAIEAGEEAISPKDLATQGVIRSDPFALRYLDDLSTVRPIIDKPIRAPESNYDPNLRMKNEDEIAKDLAKWVKDLPDEPDRVEWTRFLDETRLTVGKEEAERNPTSSLSEELPKMNDPNARYPKTGDDDEEPYMVRLRQQTGFSPQQIKNLRVKNLVNHRVVNQTRMGKIQSIYYLTIAGNGRGLLGIGEGKSTEPEDAKRQAHMAAIRNMLPINRYEERTIFGEVEGKVGAVELKLMARPPGFGVRCQQYIFEIARCAGITDLSARVTRSRNPMNVVKATFQALQSQRLPEDIARARGKKLVDVRKVYFGGNV